MDMLARNKFSHPDRTADGKRRAWVDLERLETLWFNTGTLCNLTCAHCYIESSPRNDRLVYLTAEEVAGYLDEIEAENLGTTQIGFTGGEPFMNPDFMVMVDDALSRGFQVLVLTNAMRPMMKCAGPFAEINRRHGDRLEVRVSVDHYDRDRHQEERGARSWKPTILGLKWLFENGFNLSVAGRTFWDEPESELRSGFGTLFEELGITLDVQDPARLVLFPEMDENADVPEITTECWDILNKSPADMMCAWSRMVVKRKGAVDPVVLSCTLLPYDSGFEMGRTLTEAGGSVKLNHPHCAKFCVLGGGSCSQKN